MAAELLAAYINLREGLNMSEQAVGLADAPNVMVTDNQTMGACVSRLRLHPAQKDAGDAFAYALWRCDVSMYAQACLHLQHFWMLSLTFS